MHQVLRHSQKIEKPKDDINKYMLTLNANKNTINLKLLELTTSNSYLNSTNNFMKKYKWCLYKTLEFLNSRRPDLEIRATFFQQLTSLE